MRRNTEAAIDRRQALQVAGEAVRIATARGVPQDVEWAIDADGALWILQARPMTALPPDVSWESPAPGAYTRMLRLGEWIGEPVTPLFESWLLTAMEERMHAWFREQIGQIAPRPYHVVVNGWYFYSVNFISGRAMLRSLPGMLVHLVRTPRHLAGVIPPTVRYSFPVMERMWREHMQPRYRAAVSDAEGRVSANAGRRAPRADRRPGVPCRRVFRVDRGPERRGVQARDEPRAVLSKAPASARSAAATCRSCPGSSPASEPASTAIVSLDWSDAPMPTDPAACGRRQTDIESVVGGPARRRDGGIRGVGRRTPRRLRAFRRLLADAQHLVPIREEQTSELTTAWPVLRRAVVRIGEALVARRGHRRAR